MSTRKAVVVPGAGGGSGSSTTGYDRYVWGLGIGNLLAVGTRVAPIITIERPTRLLRWRITANSAPTDASFTATSIVIDIKRNGTSSLFLAGNANKIVLASGGVRNKGTVFATSPLDTVYEDELTIDVIRIGSTFPGYRIEIQVWGLVL